jgi:Domain of unknown function (DUF4340)
MSPQVLKRLALLLAVALLIWGALVVFGRTRRDEAGGLALGRVAATEVSEIALRRGADTIVLRREGGDWSVNGLPANARGVTTFLAALGDSSTRSEVVAQSRGSHARLGVDSSTGRRLTITVAGKHAVDLWFGNRGPDFEGFYVRPQGSDVTYLLRGQFAELTAQGVPEWREKQFAAVAAESVGKVEVERGRSRWTLTRGAAGWSLGGRSADSTKVARFLAQFSGLRASGFPEQAEMDSIDFSRPERSVTLSSREGQPLLALLMDSTHGGSFWVRRAAGGPVYRVDQRVADLVAPAETTLKH